MPDKQNVEGKLTCKHCNARLKRKNLAKHIQKVHPELVKSTTSSSASGSPSSPRSLSASVNATDLNKYLAIAVACLLLILMIYVIFLKEEDEDGGNSPPTWNLREVESGQYHDSGSYYHEGLTLVIFIHTLCYKCEDMAPILEELYEKNQGRLSGMFSIGGYLFGEKDRDNQTTILDYKRKNNNTWPHLYDDTWKLKQSYKATDYIMFYFIKDDRIVKSIEGKTTYENLENQIDRFT